MTLPQPQLYVKVWTLHGQQLLHCPLMEFQRLQMGLLQKNGVLRVEIAGKPKDTLLLPGDFPFRDPPLILYTSFMPHGTVKVSSEVTIITKDGTLARVLIEFSVKAKDSDQTGLVMKALRFEIHKRMPLSPSALKNFKEWWEQVAEDLYVPAVQECLDEGVEE